MDTRSHWLAIAASLLIASPAVAQQSPPAAPNLAEPIEEPPQTPQTELEEAEALLAQASVQLADRGEESEPAVPKRRRAARVTTCRCGDPSAQ